MVKLSAMTVEEAEVYQIGGEPVDDVEVQDEAVEVDGGDGDEGAVAVATVGTEESAYKVTLCSTSWEAEALEKIKLANAHVAMMEGRHLEAKERAKDCKADWESAVNHLTEVIDDVTRPLPLFDRAPVKQETPTDPVDESWRATSINEIFKGVKGLGAKKREAIQEAIPTLGAWEDLRKKASLEGNPLREYMPKGVGQEACDQLEEASLNAISRIMTLGDEDEEEGDR